MTDGPIIGALFRLHVEKGLQAPTWRKTMFWWPIIRAATKTAPLEGKDMNWREAKDGCGAPQPAAGGGASDRIRHAACSERMRTLDLPGVGAVSAMGQGTWRVGEDASRRKAETEALRTGVELGLTVIDTAEMYGDGATESFLGEALAGLRDHVVLVSKAYPQNAGRGHIQRACEASLRRLRTDRLDLYLLHWRGSVPLVETVEGMEALKRAGKIRAWGVSNLDLHDMDELAAAGGKGCATDQVLYNVTRRGPEFDLFPALAERGVVATAYSPVEQGRLPSGGALKRAAERHGVTSVQVALAWAVRGANTLVIPKAADIAHVRQNREAADLTLTMEDLSDIDAAYPPPRRAARLQML